MPSYRAGTAGSDSIMLVWREEDPYCTSQVESSSYAVITMLLLLLLLHYIIHYRTMLLQYAWAYRDNGYHTITRREMWGAWTRIVGDSDTLLRKSRHLSPICYVV